ncbi:hypothetical protein REC12_13855 [Desulfosporosinus sp. PR]|uniref:hypothetical protein n=1 Tax=Candidatus Desulfosporosinus nitrosoreducens TaxID=3401928 RepID=UPI0027EB008D|nr:hypothetical protein [Desulfosporosinus sp. PR]MDQ7094676.1 hypothetical protein [Desulfosporosinus sp. PR]
MIFDKHVKKIIWLRAELFAKIGAKGLPAFKRSSGKMARTSAALASGESRAAEESSKFRRRAEGKIALY